ncbi:MAG: hypothetical protein ACI93R_000721 [Flavobacteriales bacterium]|jgi:hypothetical protein
MPMPIPVPVPMPMPMPQYYDGIEAGKLRASHCDDTLVTRFASPRTVKRFT